jgi:DNA-binding transcriptional MerR regulator
MRTDELLRRVEGLDSATLEACERAGWVAPERHSGGADPRWWSDSDLNKLRDLQRFRRGGFSLEEAYERARADRFFGLCPCDWR